MKTYYRSLNQVQSKSFISSLFAALFSGILLVGCSSAPTFIKSDFEKTRIRSIAIMSVTDKRNIVENKIQSTKELQNIEESLAETFTDKNYDVLLSDSVKSILNGRTGESLSPSDLCSLLNVDAVLFSDLYDYSDVFLISHSLKMSYKLFDAKGDSLWLNNVDDHDKPFLSAVGSSLGWGVGISNNSNIPSNEKFPTILAGVSAAELVYAAVDGLSNEAYQSINRAFHSLPEKKGIIK